MLFIGVLYCIVFLVYSLCAMLMIDCSVLTSVTHQTKQVAKRRPISREEIQSIEFTMPLFAYILGTYFLGD